MLPTVPQLIEAVRAGFADRGELTVTYLSFVRFAKLEEVYGWEKLDEVLETVAHAVAMLPENYSVHAGGRGAPMPADGATRGGVAVLYPYASDLVFLQVPAEGEAANTDEEATALAARVQDLVATQVEAKYGDEIAAMAEVYAGRTHVVADPKIRFERLIHRGIREAAEAANSLQQRERVRNVGLLRQSLRTRAIYIDYHPIIVAATGQVFGYEALARGVARPLRNPQVMFDIAAEADMIWELSRLCRSKAIEGLSTRLGPDELLFLNVDPNDFDDPEFTDLGASEPERVVIEITERTAIKDYPRIRERLRAFRDRGYRFAVDDAGSGYAGLGSIANLGPDFIKLDLSLITGIDTNPSKQRLAKTMVRFAEQEGAKVIAEGIERQEELTMVKQLGVHLVQGFFFTPGRTDVYATPVYNKAVTRAAERSAAPRP